MTIKSYPSNMYIFFEGEERESIRIYSDDYLCAEEPYTEDEVRDSLNDQYDLTDDEIEEIVDKMECLGWI